MRKNIEETTSIKFLGHVEASSPKVDADILFFFGPLCDVGFYELPPRVGSNPLRKKAIFVLETNSGKVSTAYAVICNLYKLYEAIALYVPTYCYGAGALIAHAVDELILGETAQVGPIDGFGNRLSILSSKAGRRAFEHLTDVDPNVGLTIDSEVRHLFDNVSEPTALLRDVTDGLVEQWSTETLKKAYRVDSSPPTA